MSKWEKIAHINGGERGMYVTQWREVDTGIFKISSQRRRGFADFTEPKITFAVSATSDKEFDTYDAARAAWAEGRLRGDEQ